MFCPECGADHHAGEREETSALDREVEIERLRTKRDIEVARIQAGSVREMADAETEVAAIEAEAGVEAAEAVAEVLEDIVAPDPPEEGSDGSVVVVQALEEPEPDPDMPPPPEAHEDSSGTHEESREKRSSYGNKGWFA